MLHFLSRKAFALLFFCACTLSGFSLDFTFTAYTWPGGYNISCHGLSNGSIDVTVVGGKAPYTYNWSNSALTEDLSGLAAGSYTLTVTDADGDHVTKSITLYEPDALGIMLDHLDYGEGYAISTNGGADGTIGASVSGGATP